MYRYKTPVRRVRWTAKGLKLKTKQQTNEARRWDASEPNKIVVGPFFHRRTDNRQLYIRPLVLEESRGTIQTSSKD